MGDIGPVCGHEVVGGNGAESQEVVVGTFIAHHADAAHIGEDGTLAGVILRGAMPEELY